MSGVASTTTSSCGDDCRLLFDINQLRTPILCRRATGGRRSIEVDNTFAFDKTFDELDSLFGIITGYYNLTTDENPFYNDANIADLLMKDRRLINSFSDTDMRQDFVYGSLGSTVNALFQAVRRKKERNPSEEFVFVTLDKDDAKIPPRVQLTNFLLLLSELCACGASSTASSSPDDDTKNHRRDFTKYFVRYLTDAFFTILKREKNAQVYQHLLERLQIVSSATVQSCGGQVHFKWNATKLIIAKLIGNNSMDSVVDLSWSCMLARYTKSIPKEKAYQILPKSLHPLCKHWATDNFFDGDAMGGDDRANLAETVSVLTQQQLDNSLVNECIETEVEDNPRLRLLEKWKTFAHKIIVGSNRPCDEQAELLTEMEELYAESLDMMSFLSSPDGFPSDGTAVSSTSSSSNRVDSPVTAGEDESRDSNNGLGVAANGLTLTIKGLCFSILTLLADAKETARESSNKAVAKKAKTLAQYLEAHLAKPAFTTWKSMGEDVELVPDNDIQRVLVGRRWTLEDFEILKILGGGSFGRVFLVRLKDAPNIRSALKVESFTLTNFAKYAGREYTDGSRVHHKNIARTLGFFPIPNIVNLNKPVCVGLLQEECGPNLSEMMENIETDTTLSIGDKVVTYLGIVAQVLAAVVVLEENSVRHRDIKLTNICQGLDGYIKLIDFGLAFEYHDDGTVTQGAGSGDYIPPEGSGTAKHDVYSTGVVLYYLLANRFPKWKEDWTPMKIRKDTLKAFKLKGLAYQDEVVDLVLGMIANDPNDRLGAVAAAAGVASILETLHDDSLLPE